MPTSTPATDTALAKKYSARTVEHKGSNKLALARMMEWPEDAKYPMLCIPTAITDASGGQLIEAMMPGILELPCRCVVRGKGSKKYGEFFMKLRQSFPHRVGIIPDDDVSLRLLLAGTDLALLPAKGCEEELHACLRYGCVPVAMPSDGLENYDPVQERGNAFLFEEGTAWQAFAALVRALETLRFPFDWRTIQRHAMETAGDRIQESLEE